MYDRKTKIFFGAMAVIMGIGFPLSLLAGFPAFQDLLSGSASGSSVTLTQIEEAREDLRAGDCDRPAGSLKGKERDKCIRAFQDLGAGYLALATATDDVTGEPPRGQDENYDKAQAALRRAYQLDPSDERVAQSLASVYLQQQKAPQAVVIYKALVKSDPSNVDYQYGLGSVAQQAQDKATAIAAFQKFLKLAPDDSRATQVKESIKALKEEGTGAAGANGLDLSSLGGAGGNVTLG